MRDARGGGPGSIVVGVLPLLLSLVHATNDLFGALLTPLLPRLQQAFGVSYGAVAVLVSVYSLSSSLMQPIAGLIADRYERRRLAALGPMMVIIGCGLMGFYPSPWVLALSMGFAGLGSALFHASGAALAGEYAPEGKKGFWLSFFSSSGQLGLSFAPVVSIGMASTVGLKGLAWLVPFALVAPLLVLRQAPPTRIERKPSTFGDLARVFRGEVAKLWVMATLRSVAFMSFATTIPYWFVQLGLPESRTALALTVYSFSATAGAFLGGTLSDRLGRKPVLVLSAALALPLYLALLTVPPAHLAYPVVLALAGMAMNAGIPVAVVMAQEHEPRQIATVSGLLMGFTWGFAGLLYALVGPLVERFGVLPTLSALGGLLVPALAVTLSLRGKPRLERPVPAD